MNMNERIELTWCLCVADCAEVLYVQLLGDAQIVGPFQSDVSGGMCGLFRSKEDVDLATNILSDTCWDADDDVDLQSQEHWIAASQRLYHVAGLESEMEEVKVDSMKRGKKDEWDSYDALVKEAGY